MITCDRQIPIDDDWMIGRCNSNGIWHFVCLKHNRKRYCDCIKPISVFDKAEFIFIGDSQVVFETWYEAYKDTLNNYLVNIKPGERLYCRFYDSVLQNGVIYEFYY